MGGPGTVEAVPGFCVSATTGGRIRQRFPSTYYCYADGSLTALTSKRNSKRKVLTGF
jgi:hypothetical protein